MFINVYIHFACLGRGQKATSGTVSRVLTPFCGEGVVFSFSQTRFSLGSGTPHTGQTS